MWPSAQPRTESSPSPAAAAFAAAAAHAHTGSISRPSPALATASLPVKPANGFGSSGALPGLIPGSPQLMPMMTPIKKKKKKTIAIIDNADCSGPNGFSSPSSLSPTSTSSSSSVDKLPRLASHGSSSNLSSSVPPSSSHHETQQLHPPRTVVHLPQDSSSASSVSHANPAHQSFSHPNTTSIPGSSTIPASSAAATTTPQTSFANHGTTPHGPTTVPATPASNGPPQQPQQQQQHSLSNGHIPPSATTQHPMNASTAQPRPTQTLPPTAPSTTTTAAGTITRPQQQPAATIAPTAATTPAPSGPSTTLNPPPPSGATSHTPQPSPKLPATTGTSPLPAAGGPPAASVTTATAANSVLTSVANNNRSGGGTTASFFTFSGTPPQTPSSVVKPAIPAATTQPPVTTPSIPLSTPTPLIATSTATAAATAVSSGPPASLPATVRAVVTPATSATLAPTTTPTAPVTPTTPATRVTAPASTVASTPTTSTAGAGGGTQVVGPATPASSHTMHTVVTPATSAAVPSPLPSPPASTLLSPPATPSSSSSSSTITKNSLSPAASPLNKPALSPSLAASSAQVSRLLSAASDDVSKRSGVPLALSDSDPETEEPAPAAAPQSEKPVPRNYVSEIVMREALSNKDRLLAESEENSARKMQALQRKHQEELQELTAKMSSLVQTHSKRAQQLQAEVHQEQEEVRKLRMTLTKEQGLRVADEQAAAQRQADLTQQIQLLKRQLLGGDATKAGSAAPVGEDVQKKVSRMTDQLMVAETEVLEARDELETSAKELRRVKELVQEERELRAQLEQQLDQLKTLFEQESKQLQLRTSALQEKDSAIERLQKYLKELEQECQGALKSASALSARVTKDKEFAIVERDRYFAQVQKLDREAQKQAERFEQETKQSAKIYEETLAKQQALADKLLLKKSKAWRTEMEAMRVKQEETLLELKEAVDTERSQSAQLIAQQQNTIEVLTAKLSKLACKGDLQTRIEQNSKIAEVELKALDEELHAVSHGPIFLRGESLRAELKEQQEQLAVQYQSLETDQETQTAMRAEVVNIQTQLDQIKDAKGRDLVLESVVALSQMQESLEEKIRQKEADVDRLRAQVTELEATCQRQAQLEEAESHQMQRRTSFLQRSRECVVREQHLWKLLQQHGVVASDEGEEHILRVLDSLLSLSTLRFQVLLERREYDFDREKKMDADEEERRMQYEGGLVELREMLAKAHNGKQKLAMQSAATIEELKRMLTSVEAQLEHNRKEQEKRSWWNFHFTKDKG